MNLLRVTVLALACALPAISLAQWQWIDKDGRKVFSDQSPPADVPDRNILKRPGVKTPVATAAEPASGTASEPAKPVAAVPKLSAKDQELGERKKRAEAAEMEKKK